MGISLGGLLRVLNTMDFLGVVPSLDHLDLQRHFRHQRFEEMISIS